MSTDHSQLFPENVQGSDEIDYKGASEGVESQTQTCGSKYVTKQYKTSRDAVVTHKVGFRSGNMRVLA